MLPYPLERAPTKNNGSLPLATDYGIGASGEIFLAGEKADK
jgi:hypothetical protein